MPSDFPTNACLFPISPLNNTCLYLLFLLDFISLKSLLRKKVKSLRCPKFEENN